MALSLADIHKLEVAETYPNAIDQLEKRIAEGYTDSETVIRLGFNLWYAVAEESRLKLPIPSEAYRSRFVGLWQDYQSRLNDDPDFCWAFGLGVSLFAHEFDSISEAEGDELLARAAQLDPFYRGQFDSADLSVRFTGRGIFESYYNTKAQPST